MSTIELKSHYIPLLLASAALLSTCSSDNSPTPPAAESSAIAPAAEANAPAVINAPLTREQVSVAIEQLGAPIYDVSDDTLNLRVKLSNNGTAPLPAQGTYQVLLGLIQLEPSTEERGTDSRAALNSDVEPGSSVEVDVKVPAVFAAGYKVQLEPLQEGVAWFGFDYDQPVLVVGPFKRCDGNPQSLCNADNSALATK